MYLLALSLCKTLKKILKADQELWGCVLFRPKLTHLPQTKHFWEKKLFSSTHCPIFKKKLEWIQSCQDVAYLCPKWSICPYANCFRKSQISINEISCNWVDPHYISIKGLATGVKKNKQIYDVVYRSIFTGFTICITVLKASLGMPDHTHLNLHYQFITLIDIKLHAQNLIYTSFSFWDLRF